MILRDDIYIFEAIGKGFKLLGKAWQQVLLTVVLNILYAYFIVGNFWSILHAIPAVLVGLLLNINVMVKIKSIYESTDKSFMTLLREAVSYWGKAILATIFAGLLFILVGAGIGLLAVLVGFLNIFISIIMFLALALIAYMFAFVVQGVVLGDLDIGHAFEISKDIFKDNLLKFVGLGVLTLIFEFIADGFSRVFYGPTFAMLAAVVGLIYVVFSNIVLCVLFYQATKCHVKPSQDHEVFEEIME